MAAPATAPVSLPSPDSWDGVASLPCALTVEVPVPGFRIADLIQLRKGAIIATAWTVGQDVPLSVNGELAAWSEFEVVQGRLAVRITELA